MVTYEEPPGKHAAANTFVNAESSEQMPDLDAADMKTRAG
jgi:hypothetical protein